ncbi:MAG: DUF58 domain-containing protein [Bacteroidetes bacterium]|nr:DUF58 domain-containing protein [Bacteroidota bacterium]
MSGSNKSQSVGTGQEFSQYKNYQPGDDLRSLDWKMFARSERYYIKQAEIETNITVKFIIDASQSLSYAENGLSKLEYAKVMTAALAYLARKQGDTFGLFSVNDKHLKVIRPRFEQQHFIRFLNELVHLKCEGGWIKNEKVDQWLDHHGKEMIIFITDLYDNDKDLFNFISRLKTSRNEVIVFHLMGKHETDFDFDGSFTFEDLESGLRTKANTSVQLKEYTKKIQEWLQHSRMWMLEKQINYQLVLLHEPVETMLRDFLNARKRLVR